MASATAPDSGQVDSPKDDRDDVLRPSSFFEPVEVERTNDVHSIVGPVSVVGSVAHTIASTIVDGLVHAVAHWKVLLLGQAISLVLAGAGASSEIMSLECGVSAPSTYNASGYFLVALFGAMAFRKESKKRQEEEIDGDQLKLHIEGDDDDFTNHEGTHDHGMDDDELTLEDDPPPRRSFFAVRGRYTNSSRRGQRDKHTSSARSRTDKRKMLVKYPFLCFTIHAKWYYYFVVAFIEAQAYYLLFLAFRYTSFTFVYISDALAIPSAMIFSRVIMKKRYSWTHLLGGVVCISGIVINTISDMEKTDPLEKVSPAEHMKGDLFAISGAVLLGLDDVLSEIIVTDFGGVNEMLFMKGFFGTIISIVQLMIFELDGARSLFGSNEGSSCDISRRMTLFSIHILTRALDVAGEMQFLFLSEAALLNLSLLTSDLYAALFDVVSVGLELTPYYYLAFCLIFTGIVLYESGPSPGESPMKTPMDIEIPHVHKSSSLFSATTEHARTVVHPDAELT
jgi:solute carrier family 35 protein F1/2